MKCPKCGYPLTNPGSRCIRCGAELAPQCTSCGSCPNRGLLCGKRERKPHKHITRWDVSA